MLVIDAGNTSVKFAIVARCHAGPRLVAHIPTARLTTSRVKTIIRRRGCSSAMASCVVPAVRKVLRSGYPSMAFIGKSSPLNLSTAVERGAVGADRLANMAEAARRFGRSVVVADFGTAATFDWLDGHGCFAGGAIAPGLRVFATALSAKTAQLPMTELRPPRRAAGRTTREALRAGVVGGYAGLVTHLLRQFPAKHVVFTGGDARLVAKLTGVKAAVDPLWTLKGIAALGALNAREARK
jgi:type III pantothenate kinase